MSEQKNQQKKTELSKKIHSRLAAAVKETGLSLSSFSVQLGNTRTWAYNLIYRTGSGLKAADLKLMEDEFSINSKYILNGENPMFLEKKESI